MVSPHKRCGGRARGARQDKRKVGGESTPALAIASSAKERYCSRKRQDVLRVGSERWKRRRRFRVLRACARGTGVYVIGRSAACTAKTLSSLGRLGTGRPSSGRRCDVWTNRVVLLIAIDSDWLLIDWPSIEGMTVFSPAGELLLWMYSSTSPSKEVFPISTSKTKAVPTESLSARDHRRRRRRRSV